MSYKITREQESVHNKTMHLSLKQEENIGDYIYILQKKKKS